MRLLYIHLASEQNRKTRWGVYNGEITQDDHNLLKIEDLGGDYSPNYDRGANASYALLSYFVEKYPPNEWKKGDPTEWDDWACECPFPEVEAQIDELMKIELKKFDFTLVNGYIEVWMVQDIMDQWIEHLRHLLRGKHEKLDEDLMKTIENWKMGWEKCKRDASPVRK